MKLVTIRDNIRTVAARWAEQYKFSSSPLFGPSKIGEKLADLDVETATAAEVDAIIGNDGWTRDRCGVCRQQVDAVVDISEIVHEEYPILFCRDCLTKALALFPADDEARIAHATLANMQAELHDLVRDTLEEANAAEDSRFLRVVNALPDAQR